MATAPLSPAEHHAAGLDALGSAASHFIQSAPGDPLAADIAQGDQDAAQAAGADDDQPGLPNADSSADPVAARGMARFGALSATRHPGFPAGSVNAATAAKMTGKT
jgi:hypothetical protein